MITLKEDTKSVVIRKPGLENREDAILLKTLLNFLDYQKSIPKNGKDSYYH